MTGHSMTKWHKEFQARDGRYGIETQGRDGRYGIETVEELLELLRAGESMNAICKMDGMPSRETIRNWGEEIPALDLAITRAREDGYVNRAEKILTYVKETTDDPAKVRIVRKVVFGQGIESPY
jgi:hypothetical protein